MSQLEEQLWNIVSWCENWGMKISESKTYVSTLSDETGWKCEGVGNEDYAFAESIAFTYLGVSFKIKGRDFLADQNKKILAKADRYVNAILHTTKDGLDQALIARSLWLHCAVLAIMYGTEACVLGKRTLDALDKKQNIIAAFITGIQKNGGNTALAIESGLMSFVARYHIGSHRFFNRALNSKSSLVSEGIWEHSLGSWLSQ